MVVEVPELIQMLLSESAPTLFVPVSWMTEPALCRPPTTKMSESFVTLIEPESVPVALYEETLALPARVMVPERVAPPSMRRAPMPPVIQNWFPLTSLAKGEGVRSAAAARPPPLVSASL